MAKKTKFKLETLKVNSFVTSLNDDEKNQIKGGTIITTILLTTTLIPDAPFYYQNTGADLDCWSAVSPIGC